MSFNFDRPMAVYEKEAIPSEFTKKLISMMKLMMHRTTMYDCKQPENVEPEFIVEDKNDPARID